MSSPAQDDGNVTAQAATATGTTAATVGEEPEASASTTVEKEQVAFKRASTTDPPSSDTAAASSVEDPPAKRRRTAAAAPKAEEEEGEVVDLCEQLGLKAGDRLEVEWQLMPEDDDEEAAADGEEAMTTKWWGCTLLEHDGRVEDGVAVRVVEYDPYLPHYAEKTREDVIFLSHDILIGPETQAEFKYRPEGVVQFNSEEETREHINAVLMSVMNKHAAQWSRLDRAQQGHIASMIAKKKELLVGAIMSHAKSPVIGPDDMKEILKGIMEK